MLVPFISLSWAQRLQDLGVAPPLPLAWLEAVIFACSETPSPDLRSLSTALPPGEHSREGPSSPAAFLPPAALPVSWRLLLPSRPPPPFTWDATGLSSGPHPWGTLPVGDLLRLPTFKCHLAPMSLASCCSRGCSQNSLQTPGLRDSVPWDTDIRRSLRPPFPHPRSTLVRGLAVHLPVRAQGPGVSPNSTSSPSTLCPWALPVSSAPARAPAGRSPRGLCPSPRPSSVSSWDERLLTGVSAPPSSRTPLDSPPTAARGAP